MSVLEPETSKAARRQAETRKKMQKSAYGKLTKMELIEKLESLSPTESIAIGSSNISERKENAKTNYQNHILPDNTPPWKEPSWASGPLAAEQEEARRNFMDNRVKLLKRLLEDKHDHDEILSFFKELQQEYHKVHTTNTMTEHVYINGKPQIEKTAASKVQVIGAQIWSSFIEQALAAHHNSGVDLRVYLEHSIHKDEEYEKRLTGENSLTNKNSMIGVTGHDIVNWHKMKHGGATIPPPVPVHSEQLQDLQEFLDTCMVNKKTTKSDLMLKYEAALEIIQEQAKMLLEGEEMLASQTINIQQQIDDGNLSNVVDHVEGMRATVADITHAKRVQRELLEGKINEQALEIARLKGEASKIVKAQEILRMGLLQSISEEFDDAVRHFLHGDEEIVDDTPKEDDDAPDML